jgi:FKBP-type peptidyl-prolyl cis-trans isomerase
MPMALIFDQIKLYLTIMKKTMMILVMALVAMNSFAQPKPAAKPAAKTPVKSTAKPAVPPAPPLKKPAPAQAPSIKTAEDSLSYAIGMLDANFFKSQGIEQVNANSLALGFSDVMKGKTLFTPEQADGIVRNQMQKLSIKKILPNIQACNDFLTENAKKKGVVQTASGLQYEVLQMGTGAKPADTNVVKVHYEGFLLNGKKFDSSRDRGEPAQFQLNGVIRGWTEGVQLMPVGSKFKFYIPYQLGYGEQGAGADIPGGSLLIFEVELLEIVQNG